MKLSKVSVWGLALLTATALVACTSPSSSSGSSTSASSGSAKSLVISIGDNINARNLAPTLSMTAANYTISGNGPTTSFGPTVVSASAGSATFSNLETGDWNVTVYAYNGDSTPSLIGSGTASATVSSSGSTPVAVSVTPIVGHGTLGLTVTWPTTEVSGTPYIQATLSPAFTTAIASSAWTVNSGTGTANYLSSSNSVPTGYSTLALNLLDSSGSKAWVIDTVRIVDQQTTTGTYALSDLNQTGGSLVVNVTTNLQNPLTVSIAGITSPSLKNGVAETLTATALDSLGNALTGTVTYVWYVDGVVKQTSASNTYSYTGNMGSYSSYRASIAVVAFAAGSYGSANVFQKVVL